MEENVRLFEAMGFSGDINDIQFPFIRNSFRNCETKLLTQLKYRTGNV